MFCPNCGKSNTPQAKFCKHCGTNLQLPAEQETEKNTNQTTDSVSDTPSNQSNISTNQAAPTYPVSQGSQYSRQNQQTTSFTAQQNNQNRQTTSFTPSQNYQTRQPSGFNMLPANQNRQTAGFNMLPENGYYQNSQQYEQRTNNPRSAGYDQNPHDGYYTDIVTEKNKSSNAVIIVAISLAALVLIVFAVVALIYFSGNKGDNSQSQAASVVAPTTTTLSPIDEDKTVEIPSVIGYTYANAVEKLYESNLQSRVTVEYSSSVPDYCIISQSPSQGTQAKEGDVVSVVMSKGVYETPNYDYFGVPSYARNDNSYIIPQSSSKYLTSSDISGFSIKTLELARNEIFARHGRRFESTELQKYFNSKSWYIGTIESSDFPESLLNEYETANADFLKKEEDKLRNPSSQSSSSNSSSSTASKTLYRVRKTWNDAESQKGAFYDLSNAKECADQNEGYSVFDENGKVVYSPKSSSSGESKQSSGSKPIFRSISSSSNLVSSKGTEYTPDNVCKDNGDCWAEGVSGSGEGEWIMFSDASEQQVKTINIVNGFAKSKQLYNENGKIKRVRFEFSDGSSYSADLTVRSNAADSNYYTVDSVTLPRTISTTYVKIVIEEAVEGTKYDDTCITLVTFG